MSLLQTIRNVPRRVERPRLGGPNVAYVIASQSPFGCGFGCFGDGLRIRGSTDIGLMCWLDDHDLIVTMIPDSEYEDNSVLDYAAHLMPGAYDQHGFTIVVFAPNDPLAVEFELRFGGSQS